jgi:phosphoglycerol transferase
MIFELPYAAFPGQAPSNTGMSGYDELKGYLHSSTLRWTGGAMIGRAEDLWIRDVSGRPVDELVASVVAAGFSGIYIDRYGYPDRGASIEDQLSSLLGARPLVSEGGRRSFFLLEPSSTAGIRANVVRYFPPNAPMPCTGSFDLTNVGAVPADMLRGFGVPEPHGRWTDGSEASFTCTLPSGQVPSTVQISTWGYVFAGHSQRVIVWVNGKKGIEVNYRPGSDLRVIELPLPNSPGAKLSIRFDLPNAVSPLELGMSSDPRRIAISVRTIEFR